VIVERSMHPRWLSNTYLVADGPGGHAVIIDGGAPTGPILKKVEALRSKVTHLLCTHHHVDHVAHNGEYKSRFDCPVCGHGLERDQFGGLDRELRDGDELVSGDLRIRAMHIPGHTVGQVAFLINDDHVFTGDTLFRGTVGGTRAPGHGSFEELRHSVLEVLMSLPPRTAVHPGHSEPTTIGEEWDNNPFIRVWRGLDPATERRCMAFEKPATLLLRARDYDGGTKCWVRFDEGERLDVVPGSRVRDL
jgi:hydroxyacylglutathione hydrolase